MVGKQYPPPASLPPPAGDIKPDTASDSTNILRWRRCPQDGGGYLPHQPQKLHQSLVSILLMPNGHQLSSLAEMS